MKRRIITTSNIQSQKNCIVIIFDDKYFKYAKNCLLSFKNYPDHPIIKVVYHGKNDNITKFINGLRNVDHMDIELNVDKYNRHNLGYIGSSMIYVRYIVWSTIFDEYDNVLYMDCDTLVLSPFPELFNRTEFFAVFDNAGQPLFNRSAYLNQEFLKLTSQDDIPHDFVNHLMINSGVLLVPKKYRSQVNFEQLHHLTDKYSPYIEHSDQSIISLWCYFNDIRISCDYQYNFLVDRLNRSSFGNTELNEAKILHFSYWKPQRNIEQLFKRGHNYITLKKIICNNSDLIN